MLFLFSGLFIVLKLLHLINYLIAVYKGNEEHKFIINKLKIKMRKDKRDLSTDYPPIYPNGWTGVLLSNQLKIKEARKFIAFGIEFVAQRCEHGQVNVIETFCQDGRDVFITESCNCSNENKETITEFGNKKLKIWKVVEQNNYIYLWYDVNNKSPNWYPSKFDRAFLMPTSTAMFSRAIIQDVFENIPDLAHLTPIHGTPIQFANITLNNWSRKFFYYDFDYVNDYVIFSKENIYYTMNVNVILFGKRLFQKTMSVVGNGLTSLIVTTNVFGNECIGIARLKPLHLDRYKTTITSYSDSNFTSKLLAFIIMIFIKTNLKGDAPIWINKSFNKNPLYTKRETKMAEYRNWTKQFNE